ncbi:MAG TPA: hypothetical protein VHT00_01320 [Stellaceae bacterium]|jgi:hypothetical protein|nr:hypothetical protein [Stellaceae bacterium]
MRGVITLQGMRMLEVACRNCDRRGRLSIARLIAQYGREDDGDLRALIAHDCPKMQKSSADIYDRCGVRAAALVLTARRPQDALGGRRAGEDDSDDVNDVKEGSALRRVSGPQAPPASLP